MRLSSPAASVLLLSNRCVSGRPVAGLMTNGKLAPKIFIISMFGPEAEVWYERMPETGLGSLLAVNISTPGLSMLYPHVHCLADHSVCQVTTGESEINAASTMMALVLSGKFDLRGTYFLSGGIAGVNPRYSTLGGVALVRFAVQVALQYELDAREMPEGFPTGYLPYGTDSPDEYPAILYGTEVFELNAGLRDLAYNYAMNANLSDNPIAANYRAKYKTALGNMYVAGTQPPSVVKCDAATSDVYYSGRLLSEAFENTTRIWTNGTGKYCMTAQEDAATLEVLLRLAIDGLVDFSRVVVMRTGADFDRPPPNISPFEHLRVLDQNGFLTAVDNIFNAGIEIIKGVLDNWDCIFEEGIKPSNYIGDIFGSLGGSPSYGPGSTTSGQGYRPAGASGDKTKKRKTTTRVSTWRRRRWLQFIG